MDGKHTTWVEIHTENLKGNIRELRGLVGNEVLLCPTVKANAYGHDAVIAGEAFLAGGADWLSVHSVEEAIKLRGAGITVPILIFGYVPMARLEDVITYDCRILLYDQERLEKLATLATAAKKEVFVHLKLETGINRQGISPDQLVTMAHYIQKTPHLTLEGVSSHFADIEDTTDSTFAMEQLSRFRETLALLEIHGVHVPIPHIANSAATMLYPETHFKLVRPGIASYGMWPAAITRQAAEEKGLIINLKTAFTWKALVAQVKTVPAGQTVGYGRTFRAEKDMQIAVVPVGYYEGYDRGAGLEGCVLIQETRCKIVGRVSMNNIMVDISHLSKVSPEEEVVLLGTQGAAEITPEEFADWTQRINYEIPTRISVGVDEYIPRIVV